MFKKILILTSLILTLSFTFSFRSNAVEVETEGVITWGTDYVAGVNVITATGDIPLEAYKIQIKIPTSAYHTYSKSGIFGVIYIRDSANVHIKQLSLNYLVALTDGILILDMRSYLSESELAIIDNFYLFIPQTYTSTIPSGYFSYLETYGKYYYYTDEAPVFVPRTSWWLEKPATVMLLRGLARIPAYAETISIVMPDSDYNSYIEGTTYARFELYSEAGVLLETINIQGNWVFGEIMQINLLDYLELGEAYYIRVYIPQTFVSVPSSNYIYWWNDNSSIQFNVDLIYYNFWVSGTITDTIIGDRATITQFIDEPADIGSFEFAYWKNAQNQRVGIGSVISTTWLDLKGELNLYAYYQLTTAIDLPEPAPTGDNAIIDVLQAFGMNNTGGHVIFWAVITIFITIIMISIQLPLFAIAIVNILVTGLLLYIGVVSMLIAIIMFTIYLLMIILSFNGGTQNE